MRGTWLGASRVLAELQCRTTDWKWEPTLSESQELNASSCMRRCTGDAACARWSYWRDGGCTLGGPEALPYAAPPAQGVLAGPASCESCQPSLQSQWPRETAELSHASWATGVQPLPGECWPKTEAGVYLPCETKVLQDMRRGWPGLCTSLTFRSVQSCAEDCKANPFCPMWQNSSGCYQGFGYHCLTRDGEDFEPSEAQRLQHGEVRVLAQLDAFKLLALQLIFDAGYYVNEADAIETCRLTCASNIQCQYWQYLTSGCYVEEPSSPVPYPLTLADVSVDDSVFVLSGEYLQHFCPPKAPAAPAAPAATALEASTTHKPGSEDAQTGAPGACVGICGMASMSRRALAAAGAVAALGLLLCCCRGSKVKSRGPSKRALEAEHPSSPEKRTAKSQDDEERPLMELSEQSVPSHDAALPASPVSVTPVYHMQPPQLPPLPQPPQLSIHGAMASGPSFGSASHSYAPSIGSLSTGSLRVPVAMPSAYPGQGAHLRRKF